MKMQNDRTAATKGSAECFTGDVYVDAIKQRLTDKCRQCPLPLHDYAAN